MPTSAEVKLFATDQEIDELKMRRAKLKDQLYDMVRQSEKAVAK